MAGEKAEGEARRLTLELSRGPLEVQAVGVNALAFIDAKYNLGEFYRHVGDEATVQAWMEGLDDERKEKVSEGLDLVLNYCLSWGVASDPPEEDVEELRAMGVATENERVLRLYWLRLLRLDDDEGGQVMFAVRRLTFAASLVAEGEE